MTQKSVIYISGFSDLQGIEKNGSYELLSDIDCGGAEIECFAPIFNGKINGNGHTISNLTLKKCIISDSELVALFESGWKAEIKNIAFANIKLAVHAGRYKPCIATLCGEMEECILSNVSFSVLDGEADYPLVYSATKCKLESITYNNGFNNTLCGHQ